MTWHEKDFEEKITPYIEDRYWRIFSNCGLNNIYRSSRDIEQNERYLFMDKELAIDTHLIFSNGSKLTFQEKTLKPYQRKYQHFTFEYYNDPQNNIEGEWFKLAAQLYFFGYAGCEKGFYLNKGCNGRCEKCEHLKKHCEYWIIDIAEMRLFLNKNYTIADMKNNKWLKWNPPPAKANFWAIPFSIFPDDVFLIKKNKTNTDKMQKILNTNDFLRIAK